MSAPDQPLRIALLAYRGKPHVGGQGVYIRHLSKALADLGHHVEVLGGQPFPVLDERVPLVELPSLDIYNDHFPMRMPGIWELKTLGDVVEVAAFSSGTFPEPLAFTVRAAQHLRRRIGEFDLVHDNQSLGYGLLAVEKMGLPVLGTIHHPITVDRRLEMEHAATPWQRFSKGRWYAFTKMQTRVASRLTRVITVSENSLGDIHRDHQVPLERLHVVPVGVDPDLFKPLPHVERRPGRLITTASADVTMKGLRYLLEALAKLRAERDVDLVVIGRPKPGGPSAQTIDELGLTDHVEFVTGVPDERIVELYAEAELAVVPSLYEGFSLPAIEAMSCGVPLVATTGGALPEVTGAAGETCFQVPPGDAAALAHEIATALDDPAARARIGAAGRERVIERWSWRHTAEQTVEQYRALLDEWPEASPFLGRRQTRS
ncbi:glycosyltransferase family 4 protein [Actinomarinicola tropica]|uniref:Glycosyltransferase n=1 Tax=Actinomarinicola tropica TaxID=2789776 RepID=A0A5Q2RPL6_9ACTN|nr:glycosyltransferase family 4 protein [Actinomarinicola tropica]QGG96386.1 glycosyltransferase [Actinomarinicola tropica]